MPVQPGTNVSSRINPGRPADSQGATREVSSAPGPADGRTPSARGENLTPCVGRRYPPSSRRRSRMLHIHCGDSSAGTLRQSDMPGEVIVWCDPVVQGPTPAVSRERRGTGPRAGYLATTAARLTAADLARRLRRKTTPWHARPSTTKWSCGSMLPLRPVDPHLRARPALAARAWKTRFSSLSALETSQASRASVAWARLHPEQLRLPLPTRRPVTPEQIALARRAWKPGLRPTPTDLAAGARRNRPASLPGRGAGPPPGQFRPPPTAWIAWSRRRWKPIAEGHDRPFSLFRAVDEREARPFIGDTMLWCAPGGARVRRNAARHDRWSRAAPALR